MVSKLLAVGVLFGALSQTFTAFAGDEVLVSTDGISVTASEFEAAIEYLVPESQQGSMRGTEKNMRGFLADYFTIKVMADVARSKDLNKTPSVQVQQAYNHNRLLVEALVDNYYASAKQPNYEVLAKESYLSDAKRFETPEQVRAEHILIAINDDQDDAALKKAQELYVQATKGKKGFAALAKEHSNDPSAASNSGDLGFFTREKMVKPFADAAFAMKKGEISKPIKTQFGYHIIHVLDQRKAGVQPFEAVKEQLIAEQKQVFKNAKRDEIVSRFRASPDIKVDEAAMQDFVKKMQQR